MSTDTFVSHVAGHAGAGVPLSRMAFDRREQRVGSRGNGAVAIASA